MERRLAGTKAEARSRPAAADLRSLSGAVLALARLYQLRDRDRVCRFGITVSQCYALEAIVSTGGCGVTELARLLALDKSTASRVAESLCAAGLARHVVEPSNRRAKRLVPTPKGRALDRRIHGEIREEHRRVFQRFSPAEVEACTAMLDALAMATSLRFRSR